MATYLASANIAVTPSIRPPQNVRIAAFTCDGLEGLSRELGFQVAVVAAVESVEAHVQRLRDLWYASGTAKTRDEWPLPIDFDNWLFRNWKQMPMDVRWFGRIPHPLGTCVDDGSLLLHLPCEVKPSKYAAAFKNGLADLRFETVARHPSTLVKRHHARRPVTVTSRYSCASVSTQNAVEVRDLIAFEPRTLPRVADVAFRTLVETAQAIETSESRHVGK